MQSWFEPHPYGVYPRGNAQDAADVLERFGTLSVLVTATAGDDKERTELPHLELFQGLLGFLEVPDLCRLARVCTGWYVMVHCTDAFKNAYTQLSPERLRFRGTWRETAVRRYLECTKGSRQEEEDDAGSPSKRRRLEVEAPAGRAGGAAPAPSPSATNAEALRHVPVRLSRPYFCDQLFQAWMCTLLPPYYHLTPAPATSNPDGPPQYKSSLRPVDRRHNLTADEFCEQYERKNIPVVLTGIADQWPIFKILQGRFENLADKKAELVRTPACADALLRCEYTGMTLDDYVAYATQQRDERPTYMFDAEFASVLDVERLYTVPPHFARDDFFSAMGAARPKHRWLIAGPARGGSSFHVDPNYTNAWNANLTGRKRWLFFPPSHTPPGVVPTENMSEVATPLSLTEWLLNNYDTAVRELRHVGYECVCEPGEIVFVPCGWWHSVINLEDSVAITQNYVSRSNLKQVVQFLRVMRGSISGINEDADDATPEAIARRQRHFADEFVEALRRREPELVARTESEIEADAAARERKRIHKVDLLDADTEGFHFSF